jgi:uncharacterized membrane protein YheB (UPF0754 family)
MAEKNWTENEIKNLIKDILKQELKDIKNDISILKQDVKKKTDEDKVRQIVRTSIVNMHKFLWQKSSNYINQI